MGSAIESSLFVRQFVEEKVKGWSSNVAFLAKVAQSQPKSQPHTAYSAFTKVGSAIRKIDLRELTCQYPSHIEPGAK